MMKVISIASLIFLIGLSTPSYSQHFKLRFSKQAFDQPFSGNVIVYLSKTERESRLRKHWTQLPVVFGLSVKVFNKLESQYEEVVSGEQLVSFEAVFSPRLHNGELGSLWNRNTGKIDTEVAEHWKKYDIVDFLKTNYDQLSPELSGKIIVTCETADILC